MMVKIKNQIFEIVDTKGNTLQNNDPVLKYVLKDEIADAAKFIIDYQKGDVEKDVKDK